MRTLILFRHGIAASHAAGGDARRPLTEDGMVKTALCAKGLSSLDTPDCIVTSPLLRARQTAELIAKTFDPEPPLEIEEALAGGNGFEKMMAAVTKRSGTTLLAVGHEPDMSGLTSWLLTGGESLSCDFKKAAACRIDFAGDPGAARGKLIYFLPPRALRAMAEAAASPTE